MGHVLFASEPEVTHSDKKNNNCAETDKLKLLCTLKSQDNFHTVGNDNVQELSPENVYLNDSNFGIKEGIVQVHKKIYKRMKLKIFLKWNYTV